MGVALAKFTGATRAGVDDLTIGIAILGADSFFFLVGELKAENNF